MHERHFPEGSEVTIEGSTGAGFFVIADGNAEVTVGGEHRATLGQGDHFGEIALIDDGVRSASIVAATDLLCYGMTAWEFRPFVEEHPQVAWSLLQVMARRYREAQAPETNTVHLNGTDIAFDAAGDGPAVLLLHAGVGDRTLWDGSSAPSASATSSSASTCPALASRRCRTSRSPISRPFGRCSTTSRSTRPRSSATVGADIVLDTALAHPERVRALVLVAPALTGWEASPELVALNEEEDALFDAGKIEEAVALNVRPGSTARAAATQPSRGCSRARG